MIRKIGVIALAITASLYANAQEKSDTVVVPLGKSSQIIFTMQDRSDVEILKHYNFQDMFQDILTKIENSDTTRVAETTTADEHDTESLANTKPADENWNVTRNDDDDDDKNDDNESNDEEWNQKVQNRSFRKGRTWQSCYFDL
jgi:hypothetical protein